MSQPHILLLQPYDGSRNSTDKNFILLFDDHEVNPYNSTYEYQNLSTILLMIFAWSMLIVGFALCCCVQCFGDMKRFKRRNSNAAAGNVNNDHHRHHHHHDRDRDRDRLQHDHLRDDSCANLNGVYGSTNDIENRTNPNEPVEICRRYPDFEAESLPSYTIVSGLPTYDDALEEFRKAGIILAPQMPVIKLFDNNGGNGTNETKENLFDIDGNVITVSSSSNNNNNNSTNATSALADDNVSIGSTCTCGNVMAASQMLVGTHNPTSQIIELSPAQLAQISQKRLSLQIAFNSPIPVRRSSRPRIDLCREVNRNNLLRSRQYANGVNGVAPTSSVDVVFPPIHRSSSTFSLTSNSNEQRYVRRYEHRGSLC